MSILIVVAHPDDEVLGCGGYAAAAAAAGHEVRSCFICGTAAARQHRPDLPDFHKQTLRAQELLGMKEPVFGDFPNLGLNAVPHLDLVRFIESAIERHGADTIFTHHPADVNDDHRRVFLACQAAIRLPQRRPAVKRLRAVYCMEILSSTDWALAGGGEAFRPDTYFEIGHQGLERKIAALEAYRGVMRPFPHPRSCEVLTGLAACRGAQAGLNYAEAFETAFRIARPGGEAHDV